MMTPNGLVRKETRQNKLSKCSTGGKMFQDYKGGLLFFFIFCSDQRVRDIQFLKKELEIKLEEIILAIDDLLVLQSRVGKALEACKEPLRVTVLCQEER